LLTPAIGDWRIDWAGQSGKPGLNDVACMEPTWSIRLRKTRPVKTTKDPKGPLSVPLDVGVIREQSAPPKPELSI
jgi:hypothetical protein